MTSTFYADKCSLIINCTAKFRSNCIIAYSVGSFYRMHTSYTRFSLVLWISRIIIFGAFMASMTERKVKKKFFMIMSCCSSLFICPVTVLQLNDENVGFMAAFGLHNAHSSRANEQRLLIATLISSNRIYRRNPFLRKTEKGRKKWNWSFLMKKSKT